MHWNIGRTNESKKRLKNEKKLGETEFRIDIVILEIKYVIWNKRKNFKYGTILSSNLVGLSCSIVN